MGPTKFILLPYKSPQIPIQNFMAPWLLRLGDPPMWAYRGPWRNLCAKFLANYVATLQGIQLLLAASHHDIWRPKQWTTRGFGWFFGLFRQFPKSLQKVMEVDISQAMNCWDHLSLELILYSIFFAKGTPLQEKCTRTCSNQHLLISKHEAITVCILWIFWLKVSGFILKTSPFTKSHFPRILGLVNGGKISPRALEFASLLWS